MRRYLFFEAIEEILEVSTVVGCFPDVFTSGPDVFTSGNQSESRAASGLTPDSASLSVF